MSHLTEYITTFEELVDQALQRIWEHPDIAINLEVMANEAVRLNDALAQTGDFAYQQLQHPTEEVDANLRHHLFWTNYTWSSLAKAFMVLWRNVLFESQKAQIAAIDHLASEKDVYRLDQQSKTAIQQALGDFLTDTEKGIAISERSKLNALTGWSLQTNPWPTYKSQLKELAQQCLRLQRDYRKLLNVATHFNEVETRVHDTVRFCQKEIDTSREIAQQATDSSGPDSKPKLAKIVQRLEELEAGISLPNHFASFTEALEYRVNSLPEQMDVAVHTAGGMVQLKDLTFRRSTQQWLDAEILPLLYEVWELSENTHNSLKMTLMNIKNRLILFIADQKDGNKEPFQRDMIERPLTLFERNAEHAKRKIEPLNRLITERLERDFNVSTIYDLSQEFLPVPLQAATLNEFRKGQGEVRSRFERLYNQVRDRVTMYRTRMEEEDNLSNAEKIVRLVQSRTDAGTNGHYASIFLTKGFIGESFAVGRKRELSHASRLIHNWKTGFRGAAVITGKRLSGKTILGELIASKFFENKVIRLSPNTLIKLNGRRITTTFDLEPALEFIVNNAPTRPPLIWIDDMELWWDIDLPLSRNVRTLRKYIDDYANRLFFLVSMSNSLKSHLNLFEETSSIFQGEINVDKMSIDEIREAIMIRHGATHKKLVDAEGEPLSAGQFRAIVRKIYHATSGNVGEILNRWSCATVKVDDERVYHQGNKNFPFPDYLNPDSAILMASIMMSKRTNEYRLRKQFGPVFSEKYAPIVQRNIGIGVLKRQLDDWLEINDVIVNDMGALMQEKDYLRYER